FRSIGRNGKVVKVRDDYIPVVSLAALFDIPGASRQVDDAVLVVVESENATMAIAVDALLGQHQVVVKNLETNFRRVAGISGATILGDGQVSLILDIAGLLRMARPELASLSA
ncbi:MAG: chemotaxis protein CheW, partial [Parazoarcus communis]